MARRDRVHCRTSRPARTRRRAKPLSAPPTPANARGAKLEDGLVRRRCGSWRFPQYWRPRDGLIGPEAARPPELWPAVVRPAFGRPFLRPCCGPGESFFGLKISGRRHGVRPRSTERASPAGAADGARRGAGTIFEENPASGKKSAHTLQSAGGYAMLCYIFPLAPTRVEVPGCHRRTPSEDRGPPFADG